MAKPAPWSAHRPRPPKSLAPFTERVRYLFGYGDVFNGGDGDTTFPDYQDAYALGCADAREDRATGGLPD